MADPNPLAPHTAPIEAGGSLRATREGGLALLTPLTPAATRWLAAQVDAEASWLGDTLVVELRYFPALADAAIAAGLLFERDAFPN